MQDPAERAPKVPRGWDLLLLGSALVTVAPLLFVEHLPFSDLPEHVATMATLRHWLDPAWHGPETYELAFGRSQYLAYHLAGALLMFVVKSAVAANLVLLVATGLALPYAVRELLRAFGTDERLALLAPSVFWSRPLLVGLLPYVAAIPLTVLVLALVVRQSRAPTRRRFALISVLAVVDFYLHLGAYALMATASLGLALAHSEGPLLQRLARLPRAVAWLAPSLVAAISWATHAEPGAGVAALGTDAAFLPYGILPQLFAGWTHDIWRSHVDEITGVGFWLIVTWLALGQRSGESGGVRSVLFRWIPFATTLLLFCALPFRVGPAAMINIRLAVFLPLFVLCVPKPNRDASSRAPLLAAVLLNVVVAGNAAYEMAACNRELGAFDLALATIEPGSRLLTLQFDRDSSHSFFPPWIHVGALHRARQGGVASVSFAELPHWPVRYRADRAPPTRPMRFWEFAPCAYRNAVDGPHYDYILVRGDLDPFASAPPGPHYQRTAAVDRWSVYQRTSNTNPGHSEADRGPCPPASAP